MTISQFILDFKKRFASEGSTDAWPSILVALRRDSQVWEALEYSDLGKNALACLPRRAESWSPAALALLALEEPLSLSELCALPLQPLDPAIRRQAARAYEEWQSGTVPTPRNLGQAGLLALSLRERRRLKGSWDGLAVELQARGDSSRSVLACVFRMIPDPADLMRALLTAGGSAPELALHALLCNPMPEPVQAELLAALLDELPLPQRLPVFRRLAFLSPGLAAELTGHLAADPAVAADLAAVSREDSLEAALSIDIEPEQAALISQLHSLSRLLYSADTLSLAGRPSQSILLLQRSLETVRGLQACLTARLGRDASQIQDYQAALEAWKGTVQLNPRAVWAAAGLARVLLQTGRPADALSFLTTRQSEGSFPTHPSLALLAAQASLRLGEVEEACQAAVQAIEAIENGVSPLAGEELDFYPTLSRLLLDLDRPDEASRSAGCGLAEQPNHPELLTLLAHARLAVCQPSAALPTVTLAYALAPEQAGLRRLLVEIQEAAGEWEAALEERAGLIQSLENPSGVELRALAGCALRAGQPSAAAKACRQALQLDPNDGLAYGLLGEATLALDNSPKAMEHFRQATELAPNQAAPWMALSKAYQSAGQSTKALEVLRSASLAAPDEPEIHLALGEACLAENSPTQALASFRRAASLASKEGGALTKGGGESSHSPRGAQVFSKPVEPVASPENRSLRIRIALPLGQTLLQLGHIEEARQVLEEAHYSNPFDNAITYSYGKTLLALGQLQAALAPLKSVAEARPEDAAPVLDYVRTLLDVTEQPEAEAQRVLPLLRNVIKVDPENEEARALLAEALAAIGEINKASEVYRRALETPLAQQPAWKARLTLGLGRVALSLGQLETAIAVLQESSLADPKNNQTYRALSQAYREAGLFDEAFLAARCALDLSATNLGTLTWFAEQVLRLHDTPGGAHLQAQEEAITALTRATQLAPTRMDLLIRLGQVQMQVGDRAGALETFGRLVSPDLPINKTQEADPNVSLAELFQAAQSLRQLGDHQRAVALLERAVELKKHSANSVEAGQQGTGLLDLLVELASTRRMTGDLNSALDAFDQAISLNPAEPALSSAKANLLLEMNRPQAALACLKNALNLGKPNALLHLRAAQILRATGDLPAAQDHAEAAIAAADAEGDAALNLSSHCLAADLARAMLQPRLAQELLGEAWPKGDGLQDEELFDYTCLRAELALELGEEAKASEAVLIALKLAPEHPRCLAAQARLRDRRPSTDEAAPGTQDAAQLLQAALQASPESGTGSLATWMGVGLAAIELAQWKPAISLLTRVAEAIPEEPLSHLTLARTFVLRAEAQRLCAALEVIRHAPGSAALGADAAQAFETNLGAAAALVGRWQAAVSTDSSSNTEKPGSPDKRPIGPVAAAALIDRWRARGRAAFGPTPENADAFAAIVETHIDPAFLRAEETAALVMAYRQVEERASAVRTAQAFPQHSLVLMQLALTQSEINPRQGLGVASSAAAYAPRLVHGRSFLLPMLQILLARLANAIGGRAGDHVAAQQAIQNALAIWPDEPRWQALGADISMARHAPSSLPDPQSAIAHLQKAIELEPEFAPHHLALGEIYLESGNASAAMQVFEQATRLAPEEAGPWLALAQAQQDAGDMEGAAASAERAIEKSTNPIAPLLLRGELALQSNNSRGALSRAQSVLRLEPDHPQALHLLARALLAMNRADEALAALEKAISLVEKPLSMQLERARLLKGARGLDASLSALQDLAEKNPEEPSVLALLAEDLIEAGQSEAAVQAARLALQIDTGELSLEAHANLHYLIGRQLRRIGQLDQAIHHLSEAIRHGTEHLEAYLELGRTHQDRRQHVQALQVYRQAIGVAPSDSRFYYQAGMALKEIKDYLEAESMLRHAAELAPSDVSIHRLLGAVVALNLVHNRRQTTMSG